MDLSSQMSGVDIRQSKVFLKMWTSKVEKENAFSSNWWGREVRIFQQEQKQPAAGYMSTLSMCYIVNHT